MSDEKKDVIRDKLNQVRAELMAFVQTVTDEQWEAQVFAEGSAWTVADLFRHVVDSERGMTAQMVQFQEGKDPIPPDFDLSRWNARVVSKSKDKTPADLIADLATNRAQLLQFIAGLAPEDWAKSGRHASLRIMSIEQVCELIATHEAGHLQNMRSALA
jgi:uncharacterized protein (TIGR03083 family)